MKILVGKITKAQGIKGEVRVVCFLDTPEMLHGIKTLFIENTEHAVTSLRIDKGMLVIKFSNIDDRNSAESFRDYDVYAKKSDIDLPEGSYLISDLINSVVYLDDGTKIGTLVDIGKYGSADVYTCKTASGEISFPLVNDIISEIDTTMSKIVLYKKRFSEVAMDENSEIIKD